MKALLFIQKLRNLVHSIEETGGDPVLFVNLDHQLLNRLKQYAFENLQQHDENVLRQLQYFIDDLLSRDIFATRIRYCIVKLQEFAIAEKEYFEYISRAIDLQFQHPRSPRYGITNSASDAKELLIAEIGNCFQLWYRPEDLFLVDFSQERQLIFSNPETRTWTVSNLGNYFAGLFPFEAIAFLCALEIVMTLELHERAFVSMEVLRQLLDSRENGTPLDHKLTQPYFLRMFGIIRGFYSGRRDIEVSDFGYRVLSYVHQNLGQLQDVILLLLESEATGFDYKRDSDLDELLCTVEQSTMLPIDQKKSVKKAIDLYRSGSQLDSLRIIYPVIEGTLDLALDNFGVQGSSLSGMKSKAKKLAEEGAISSVMSTTVEIFSSRNKVVHGNILEEDHELIRPLFELVTAYLHRLLTELERVKS
jgi:hypothetical protein